MEKLDTIYITVGSIELEVIGYCNSCCFEIREIYLGKTDIYDLLLDLENHFNLNMTVITEMINAECEDYNDRVYNSENQI